jgi:hypothetical protein
MNNKLEHIVIKYLNKLYGDLGEYKTDKYPDSVLFARGKKVYMEQDLENVALIVDYDTIWSDLENMFSLENDEIKSIINKWVEATYNLRSVITFPEDLMQFYTVE